jgi:hypothetical protein
MRKTHHGRMRNRLTSQKRGCSDTSCSDRISSQSYSPRYTSDFERYPRSSIEAANPGRGPWVKFCPGCLPSDANVWTRRKGDINATRSQLYTTQVPTLYHTQSAAPLQSFILGLRELGCFATPHSHGGEYYMSIRQTSTSCFAMGFSLSGRRAYGML